MVGKTMFPALGAVVSIAVAVVPGASAQVGQVGSKPAVSSLTVASAAPPTGTANSASGSSASDGYAVEVKGVGKLRSGPDPQAFAVVDAKDRLHVLSAARFDYQRPTATESYYVRSLKTGHTTTTTLTFKHPTDGPFRLSLLPSGRRVLTMVVGCGSIYTSATPAADITLKTPVNTGITGNYCGGPGDADNEDHDFYDSTTLSDGQVIIAVANLTTDTPYLQLFLGAPGKKFTLLNNVTVPGGDWSYSGLVGRSLGSLRMLLDSGRSQPSGEYLSRLGAGGEWSTPVRVIDTPPDCSAFDYLIDSDVEDHGRLSVIFVRLRASTGQPAGYYSATARSASSPSHPQRIPGTGAGTTPPVVQAVGPGHKIHLLFERVKGLVEQTQTAHGWNSAGYVVHDRHASALQIIPRHDGKTPLVLYLHEIT
jgi:hypothetical protein